MIRSSKSPSLFTTEFELAVERWEAVLPPHQQHAFRTEFRAFGVRYEAALDTLESIWERRELAYAFDESTGLASRGSFRNYLIAVLSEPPSPGLTAIGVLFIDVDDLKRLNDTAGHQTGDDAIAAVGAIVREALREPHLDCVARVADDAWAVGRHGGDEFVAALPLTDPSEIEKIATRVKAQVDDRDRQRARGYAGSINLTVSIGVVVYELSAEPPAIGLNALATGLIAAADRLMYQAKGDGLVHIARARFTDKLEFGDERPVPAINMSGPSDRRVQPRVKLSTPITAKLVGTKDTFTLDEASTGGFSIRSPKAFLPATAYRFRVEGPTGRSAVVLAVCRYCRPVENESTHVVGFQFEPQDTQSRRPILGAIANEAP